MRFRIRCTSYKPPPPPAVAEGAGYFVEVPDLAALLALAGDECIIVFGPGSGEDPPVIEIYDDYRE